MLIILRASLLSSVLAALAFWIVDFLVANGGLWHVAIPKEAPLYSAAFVFFAAFFCAAATADR